MSPVRIIIKNHGSIKVEGDFELADASGKLFDLGGRDRISLCRCGWSQDMPFCDGLHKEKGFASMVEARPLPPLPGKE
jgi:CDGSH-type Zn-finger protein